MEEAAKLLLKISDAKIRRDAVEQIKILADLKDIHRFIFQDLFDWAGQIRTIDIGKNNLFCPWLHEDGYGRC